MKNKIIYLLIIIVAIGMGIVFSDMKTNARYSSSANLYANPDLASTYFVSSMLSSNEANISPNDNITIQYQLTNQDNQGNVNENHLKFYFNLLDENGNSATKVTISSLTIGQTNYSYVNGKGFGPIELAYDGTTVDTKTISLVLSCSNNFTARETLNYKINLLAEDAVDDTINKSQTDDIRLNVILYTITYNLNGGTNDSGNPAIFLDGQTITFNNPTRTGFTFQGWYEESDFSGAQVTTISNRTSDVTLYAKWKAIYIFYFQLPPDWYGTNVYANLSNADRSQELKNQTVTLKDSSRNIYEYKVESSSAYTKIVNGTYTKLSFTNGIDIEDTLRQARITQEITISANDIEKVFVPELYNVANQIRVFGFGSELYLYLWKNGTNTNNSWPGVVLSDFVALRTPKYIINTNTYNRMIFSNVKSDGRHQTADLNTPSYQDLTYKMTSKITSGSNNGKYNNAFGRYVYMGSWHDYNTWTSSEYTTWNTTGDGASFRATKTALGL